MNERWQNQEEAFQFAMKHTAVMLDMDMGTGKTRVAIDVVMNRYNVNKVLVVCPKAVIPVWRSNLIKFHYGENWDCWDNVKGTIANKTESIDSFLEYSRYSFLFVVVNYDIVWRKPLGDYLLSVGFDAVILDESHRAKAAGSKVSKYLAMLGKRVRYRMCLSGTPMANSPLDVYGQYRFLDPSIFGTRHDVFLQQYAIMGGPERRFVVGYKNQQELKDKFKSIAYSCKMSDISDRLKLPDILPSTIVEVELPSKDMATCKKLSKEFIAECGSGNVVVNNILSKMLRLQQITSGFCAVQEDPFSQPRVEELNTSKGDELTEMLEDISHEASVVVFCVFTHDLDTVAISALKAKRNTFELSGRTNQLEEWKKHPGAVIAVQIQAGAEGVDMTCANHAIYLSLPHSLALYNQSKARLYRPGQTRPVNFCHILAKGTIDELMYKTLDKKQDIIEAIKCGNIDFGYIK